MKPEGKIKKNLGIGALIASAFFLFNPDIAIIDFIPDVFGYLLLMYGISQLSELNEKIAQARHCFLKAALCNAVKTGLIAVLFGLVSPREMPVSILLFTFVMNFFDLVFVIPGYVHLFGGLIFLGERNDGDFLLKRKLIPMRRKTYDYSLLSPEKEKRIALREAKLERARQRKNSRARSNIERFYRKTVVFVIFKAVTPVLPELTSLLGDGFNNSIVNYYDFIGLYRIISMLILLLVGIFWLVSAVRFYFGLVRDKMFITALKEKYKAEIMPRHAYFARKFAKKASLLFIITGFLFTNIYFDEQNILPDIIAALLLLAAALCVRKYTSKWKLAAFSSVLLGVMSIALEVLRTSFNSEFIKEQIMKNPEAYTFWKNMLGVSIAEGVFASLAIASMLICAADIVKKYSGYFTEGTDAFDPERATKELHGELIRPLYVTGIFGVLSCACVPLYFWSLGSRFEAVWFFDLTFSLIFAFCFMQNLLDITANVNYKHFAGDE